MRFTLKEKKPETSDVTSFVWEPEQPVEWKAGQFLHYILKHPNADDRNEDRWFTVSSAPYERTPQITTRFTPEKGSTFKNALKNLEPGDAIEVDGPADGDFTIEDFSKSFVFIAGGIGVTPFHSMLKQMDHDGDPINVTLLYANRTGEVPFKEEFEEIASRHDTFKIHYILDPQRIDEDIIRQYVPHLESAIFYVSGPEPMVDAMNEMLKKMGVPEEHLKGDWFPGYPME